MAVFESDRYPHLVVHRVGEFVDGRLEVSDPIAVGLLRTLAEGGQYGITEVTPPKAAAKPTK